MRSIERFDHFFSSLEETGAKSLATPALVLWYLATYGVTRIIANHVTVSRLVAPSRWPVFLGHKNYQ